MKLATRSVSPAAALSILALLAVSPVGAHPPNAPYDNTIFAPIEPAAGFAMDLKPVASGLVAPLKGVTAPGEHRRLYVVDQPGQLWAIDLQTGAKTLFLDVGSRLVTLGVAGPGSFDERGFLGVAFHPQYRHNGKLYTYTSEPPAGAPTFPTTLPPGTPPDHQNVLSEWKAVQPGNPAAGVDLGSRRELLRVDWPQFNHNGGDLAFGPDGMLYFAMGDGGGADDTDGEPFAGRPVVGHGTGNAQNRRNPLGKIHRIDVGGTDARNGQYGIPRDNPFVHEADAVKEIFAYGFRNPFRFSFDSGSGRLITGDVGQNEIEEVDVVVSGGNYGWNRKEGTLCFDPRAESPSVASPSCPPGLPPLPANLIDPIAQYDTHHEGHSVIGGFVYHGREIPQLRGRYVFAEWSRLFAFPNGPDNYGRLLYVEDRNLGRGGGLRKIQEFQGFADAAARLGLTDPARPDAAFDQTLSVLGMGQDSRGEVHVLGNLTGRPFGTGGVVLQLAPDDCDRLPPIIQLPDGFQPEGITTGRNGLLYVASISNGGIYAADARTGAGSILVPPRAGRGAVGLKFDARTDHLFVAGGPTGHAFVYRAADGAPVADLTLAAAEPPTFINDVILTRRAAYFTDSFRPVFYRVPLDRGGQLPRQPTVQAIPLGGDFEFVPGEFNANGIESIDDGRQLLIVNGKTGKLYRVDADTGVAAAIDLGASSVVNGDGLVLRGRTLHVVENFSNQVAVVKLSRDFDRGELERVITHPNFDIPATATVFKHGLYVTNARFTTPNSPTTRYWLTRIPLGHGHSH